MTQKTYLFTGKKVAFSVGLLASGSDQTGPFDTRTTLIYKKIFTNTENVYDSNTGNLCHSHFFIMLIMMFKYIFKHIQSEFICLAGIFTAPVNGVYFFRFYAHAHSTKQMAVSLYKNDQIQCSVFTEKPVTNTNGSNGVVLSLVKGDRVSTQLWENSWVYDDDNSYTSFSGFLLFPL